MIEKLVCETSRILKDENPPPGATSTKSILENSLEFGLLVLYFIIDRDRRRLALYSPELWAWEHRLRL